MELKTLLDSIIEELDNNNITKQRQRYLIDYKEKLEKYINKHPEEKRIPSSLELYCDENPEAPECLRYDI